MTPINTNAENTQHERKINVSFKSLQMSNIYILVLT